MIAGVVGLQADAPVIFSWTDWHVHPSIAIGIIAAAVVYLVGVGPLRERYELAERADPVKGIAFGAGLLVLLFALQSPLHDLGDDYLFSAHMTQHMILILLVPPLLLWGTPGWLLRPVLVHRRVFPVAQLITRPLIAIALFNVTLLLWHLPSAYEATLAIREVHVLEHMLFLGTATLLWWPVLSPVKELPRLSPPLQMLYLFVQSLMPAVLGSIITFSGQVLYETYATAPRVWDVSPLLDQQMGGLIMKIPGTLVLWGALTVVFFRWAGQEQEHTKEDGKTKERISP